MKKLKKRWGALLLATAMIMSTIGSVTIVSADSVKGGSLIDFSFPFDFLLFHLGKEEDKMTEEDLEAERDRLREQSMTAEKAAGMTIVYEYTMEEPAELSVLDISACKGDGTFAFAKPELVPEKGVTVSEIIFTPNDAEKYDYDQMLGWDKETKTLRRYVEVVCTSLAALEEEVTDIPEESVIPEATGTPEVTETPEITGTPEVTGTPEITGTPEATETPGVTEIPEATGTPEATETPEVTEIPEATGTPEATETPEVTETPEKDESSKPGNNLIPEITGIPEAITPTPVPEPTATPEPEVTAPIGAGSSAESGVLIIKKDEDVKEFEAQVLAMKESVETDADMSALIELTKNYETFSDEQKNAVSSDVIQKLCLLQEEAADINHVSNGVTVAGNLPWFVQLRVTVGNDTDTYVPTGLETIVPYEMCLWNLLTDTKYELAGGEKVTLTMAVPENVHLYDGLTIVHYMDETHYEYIELKITGENMSFETASFSPFNVAGSTILVGGKPGTSGNNGTTKPSETKPATPTTTPSQDQTSGNNTTKPSKDHSKKDQGTKPVTGNSNHNVKTGDDTNISRVVILGIGAAVVIVLCIVLIYKSRKEDE